MSHVEEDSVATERLKLVKPGGWSIRNFKVGEDDVATERLKLAANREQVYGGDGSVEEHAVAIERLKHVLLPGHAPREKC